MIMMAAAAARIPLGSIMAFFTTATLATVGTLHHTTEAARTSVVP